MAEEDIAIEELRKALGRVCNLPRPSLRNKILSETMVWIAKQLNVKIEYENIQTPEVCIDSKKDGYELKYRGCADHAPEFYSDCIECRAIAETTT